jgi:hypothetical protein
LFSVKLEWLDTLRKDPDRLTCALVGKVNLRPLIFLDIDDVLCIGEELNSAQVMFCFKNEDLDWPDLWENVIDTSVAERLKSLHDEFSPLYIVNSSWASYLSRTQMSEVFSRTKLSFVQEKMHEEWCSSQPRKNFGLTNTTRSIEMNAARNFITVKLKMLEVIELNNEVRIKIIIFWSAVSHPVPHGISDNPALLYLVIEASMSVTVYPYVSFGCQII